MGTDSSFESEEPGGRPARRLEQQLSGLFPAGDVPEGELPPALRGRRPAETEQGGAEHPQDDDPGLDDEPADRDDGNGRP